MAIISGVAVILLGGGAAAYIGVNTWRGDRATAAAAHREQRVAPVVDLAPVPLGSAEPMAGDDAADAWGYPEKHIDAAVLRSMLQHRRFAELTKLLEQLQDEFEADNKREYWPIDAGEAFHSPEATLLPLLDEWAAATPSSFAPYLSRAEHWNAAGYARRGDEWAKDTPGEDFQSMGNAMAHASTDLDRALKLRPKLVAAHRARIQIAMAMGQPQVAKAAIDAATAACPACFQVRVTYMFALTPRWGGTYDQMLVFARASQYPTYPRLRLLEGYIDFDKARMLFTDKRFDEALAAINRACALGDHWEFLVERARIEWARGDLPAALGDLDRAEVLRPGMLEALLVRSSVHYALKHFELAAVDLLRALRQDPTDRRGRDLVPRVVSGLEFEASSLIKAGNRAEALRIIDMAAELAPTDHKVEAVHATVVSYGTKPDASGVATLEQNVREHPDDFVAVIQLDYALSEQRDFAKILKLWTDYLSRHPDDGRALVERSGTYWRLNEFAEAHADATRACELGLTVGCARAKQIAPRVK